MARQRERFGNINLNGGKHKIGRPVIACQARQFGRITPLPSPLSEPASLSQNRPLKL
jgi:hypothetical protein